MCKEGQSGRYSLPMESGEGAMEASSALKTISSESWVKGKMNTGGWAMNTVTWWVGLKQGCGGM